MAKNVQHKRVLIVDDEPHVAMVLADALEKLGDQYIFDTAQDSKKALDMIQNAPQPYDLVITDYRMPGMSGIDLATAIRSVSPNTQVVLMTAFGADRLRDRTQYLGIRGYIDKPFKIDEIRAIVSNALALTSHQDADQPAALWDDFDASAQLQTLRTNTGARSVLLLSADGYTIDSVGTTQDLDLTSLGALVAANFIAAAEVARLLGSGSVFKSSYHEGPDYNIYSYQINNELLLAVIFGAESKPGVVWFYTKQAAVEIAKTAPVTQSAGLWGHAPAEHVQAELEAGFDQLLSVPTSPKTAGPRAVPAPTTAKTAVPTQTAEPSESSGPAQPAGPTPLLSFEQALQQGLIHTSQDA